MIEPNSRLHASSLSGSAAAPEIVPPTPAAPASAMPRPSSARRLTRPLPATKSSEGVRPPRSDVSMMSSRRASGAPLSLRRRQCCAWEGAVVQMMVARMERSGMRDKPLPDFAPLNPGYRGVRQVVTIGLQPRGERNLMGVLIDGIWTDGELPQETGDGGQFKRADSSFRDRITADGSSGFKAEPGRYHLYVAHGCPWAHRTLIYRALKKLDGAISVAYAVPGLKKNGWTFEDDPRFPDCTPDTVNGFRYLHEAYTATDKTYTGKVTVPTLWDKKTKRIVNNESSEIIRMLNSEFNAVTGDRTDFYPAALRAEIDAINARVYHGVNNGVYRCGFAKSQAAYEEAYDGLFATLDELEERLLHRRYLLGNQLTEADWRLFPTLVR